MNYIVKKNINIKRYNLAVAIPVFNNPQNIKLLYEDFYKSKFKNILLCFVDDSNNSESINEIEKYFKKNIVIFKGPRKKNGRNIAVHFVFKWILKNLNIKYLAEFDSDNSYRFIDLKKGFKKIKNTNSDMIIGSKYLKGSKIIKRPTIRNLISSFTSFVCKNLFVKKINDYTNAQRIYSAKFYEKILKKKVFFESPHENLNILLYSIQIKGKISEYETWYIGNDQSHWVSNYFTLIKDGFTTLNLILFYFFKKLFN